MENSQLSNLDKEYLKKRTELERRIGLPLSGTSFEKFAESSPNLETWLEVMTLIDGKEPEGEELAVIMDMYPDT